MSSPFLNDPQHWQDRADQMRSLAGDTNDLESRTIMLRLANDYELLAGRTTCLWAGAVKVGALALAGEGALPFEAAVEAVG